MMIREKFALCTENDRHVRIDPEYKTELFLGYDLTGNMQLIVRGTITSLKIDSTEFINVQLENIKDEMYSLSFTLIDQSFQSIFIKFCEDICTVCEKNLKKNPIETALRRWKFWKKMFGNKNQSFLSDAEIQGLIGELLELKNEFLAKRTEKEAVESWLGPLGGHKDFEIDYTWYEIKTIEESVKEIQISSLEQLDSDREGHLVVYVLRNTSNVSFGSINLNSLVNSIIVSIQDPDNLGLFWNKLSIKGYHLDDYYNTKSFLFKDRIVYLVNSNFPKLVRSAINPAIEGATYSINLQAINKFKE